MIQEERYNRIMDYLRLEKVASLKQIADVVKVSVDTVRRDVAYLASKGILEKVRGGALYNDASRTGPFSVRSIDHRDMKKELTTCIRQVLCDGQTVGINGGTTSVEVAKYLVENYSNLVVITNSLVVMDIILKAGKFMGILLGGTVNPEEFCTYGPVCERELAEYHIDVSFFAVNSISLESGITDFRINESGVIKAMHAASKKNYVVADSSKFDKSAFMGLMKLSQIDAIITDSQISPDVKQRYGEVVRLIHP